eukprot:GGOE01043671.1.p1 GENE.GGOE01043671.1~~GGOE01043671.1.p1  ORF type:complete len:290 (+),score=34.74 GGOE01043671.1:37-906(+)
MGAFRGITRHKLPGRGSRKQKARIQRQAANHGHGFKRLGNGLRQQRTQKLKAAKTPAFVEGRQVSATVASKRHLASDTCPSTLQGSETLPLPAAVRRWMASCGHRQLTPFQSQVFSKVAAGHTCLVQCSGSRDDPLFVLRLAPTGRLQAVALYPTKEQALNDLKVAKPLFNSAGLVVAACSGGIPKQVMKKTFSQPIDVCLATPKCLVDVCQSGTLNASSIQLVLLHQVEELMTLGVLQEVNEVLHRTAEGRQGVLFAKQTNTLVTQYTTQLFGQHISLKHPQAHDEVK